MARKAKKIAAPVVEQEILPPVDTTLPMGENGNSLVDGDEGGDYVEGEFDHERPECALDHVIDVGVQGVNEALDSALTDLETSKLLADVSNNTPVVATSTGKRLVKRTNLPWRRKYYFLDEKVYAEKADALKKKASQLQLMLKYMAENNITSADTSAMGDSICSGAIEKNYVKTKISPPVLFAYYRKDMEQFGLVFAGYNMEH